MIIPLKLIKFQHSSKAMGTKKVIRGLIYVIVFTILTACPYNTERDECVNQWIQVEEVNDLIRIFPVQDEYHLGETLTVEISIDSQSDFFNQPVDIYDYTMAEESLLGGLGINMDNSMWENNYTLLEGDLRIIDVSQIMFLVYYPEEDKYKFKCTFEFTNEGEYVIPNNFRIGFKGSDLCKRVSIENTDIMNIPDNEEFTFSVLP